MNAGEQPLTDHVIVAGYGLNGRNLAAALRSIEAPYLIVELNAQTVRQARSRGEPAFYGDATREEILRALGIDRARMLVAAISDPAATRRMVRVARGLNPGVHIIARTRYVVEIPELIRLGSTAPRLSVSSSRSGPPTTRRSAPAPQAANACASVRSAGCRAADHRAASKRGGGAT